MSQVVKRVSKINSWKPKASEVLVERDGKIFICHFEKLFGHKEKLEIYDRFIIGKESYINQLDIITGYTNFFMNNYDDDQELGMAYLRLKFALDKQHLFTAENMSAYIDFIYETIFTETMIDKIIKMVEENYLDDIETTDEDKSKYVKNDKKHLESLEFTNIHIKILLEISFSMKIMSPVLFHYLQKNGIKIEKDSDIIYQFYRRLFGLFGYSDKYELYSDEDELIESGLDREPIEDFIKKNNVKPFVIAENNRKLYYFISEKDGRNYYYTKGIVDLYVKLYTYVKAKVLEAYSNNSPIFGQREIFGTDVSEVIKQFTRKVLISENVVKYKFNEHYDEKLKKYKENVIGFNKTIIKFQLS